MKNTFGSDLSLTIFGESHGRAIGAVLDGMAAGLPVDETFLAACMDKRRARGDGLSTPRVEADTVQLLSGVVNGRTTGTAIALMIENTNTRSGDYANTADLLRPGHADYTAYAKYHGFQDARGGGHFSGRVTAALVAGGAIVLSALHRAGIDITTHIAECAGIADTRFAQDDAAQLSAQVEALASKPEGFAVLDAHKVDEFRQGTHTGHVFNFGKDTDIRSPGFFQRMAQGQNICFAAHKRQHHTGNTALLCNFQVLQVFLRQGRREHRKARCSNAFAALQGAAAHHGAHKGFRQCLCDLHQKLAVVQQKLLARRSRLYQSCRARYAV